MKKNDALENMLVCAWHFNLLQAQETVSKTHRRESLQLAEMAHEMISDLRKNGCLTKEEYGRK